MRIITVLVFLGASLFMWTIPLQSQAASLNYPPRAMTAANVRGLWGSPKATRGPIGIRRYREWIYPHFIVVFERGFVIHTVHTHPLDLPAPDRVPRMRPRLR
ncbi:MAG: hypothetical protein ACYCS1_06020 [Gammaproteobacteria bacterium]